MLRVVVGRRWEIRALQEAMYSAEPELVAVYGRRRVGKTFLIRQLFADALVFELTGSHSSKMAAQLYPSRS